ncbi:MAG: hypothetical protein U0325_28225 [Polyangiales bacterium]
MSDRRRAGVVAALSLLYAAQGIPFGFAAEFLPVVLREGGASRTLIAVTGWLQAPWQLKILWSPLADRPAVRARAKEILLGLQMLLAAVMALHALFAGPPPVLAGWFALTFLAALVAATQDIFVDAFAVRTLGEKDRGYGNAAQVAGYRVGMIVGGGGMLVLSRSLGPRGTLLACAALIAAVSVGAFALRGEPAGEVARDAERPQPPARGAGSSLALLRDLVRAAWPVTVVALTYKLGVHAASGILKPLLVDHGWDRAAIGHAVVTFGAAASVLGSLLGAQMHRAWGERAAMIAAAVLQAAAVGGGPPGEREHAPRTLSTALIALEHLASGAGTTALFAGLMTATRRDRAALHYTALTSLNVVAIFAGSMLGAGLADLFGVGPTFVASAALCLAPLPLLRRWDRHAAQSAGLEELPAAP